METNDYHAFCQQPYRITTNQQITSIPYLNLSIHLHKNTSGNHKMHICIELHPTKLKQTEEAVTTNGILADFSCCVIMTSSLWLSQLWIRFYFFYPEYSVSLRFLISKTQQKPTMKVTAELEGGMTGWGEFQRQKGDCVKARTTLQRKKTTRFLSSADHQSRGIQGQKS